MYLHKYTLYEHVVFLDKFIEILNTKKRKKNGRTTTTAEEHRQFKYFFLCVSK